jgi:hypothetical protein
MPATALLPNHLRPRREKVFGPGPRRKLDRNAKVRIKTLARALTRPRAPGKHYGILTAKFVAVLDALLWSFHNADSGRCDPGYKAIAAKADCAPSTVGEAIKALELAGILSWANRIVRERVHERDLFGHWATRWRLIRTSNAYLFNDPGAGPPRPQSSNTEIQGGTSNQAFISSGTASASSVLDPDNPLDRALISLGRCVGAVPEGAT